MPTIRIDDEVRATLKAEKRNLYAVGNPNPTYSDAIRSLLRVAWIAEADNGLIEGVVRRASEPPRRGKPSGPLAESETKTGRGSS